MTTIAETVKCRWCTHTATAAGWGAALTRLYRHVLDEHPSHRFERIEDRKVSR